MPVDGSEDGAFLNICCRKPGFERGDPTVYRSAVRNADLAPDALLVGLRLTARKIERFGWTFAPGDKVIQVDNNYEREVYNGNLGAACALGENSSLNPKRSRRSECAIGLTSVSRYDPWY
jgi:hypothetical protein